MKKIGIFGATGYTGEEIMRLLVRHPHTQVSFLTSEQESGSPVSKVYPHLTQYRDMQFISAADAAGQNADLVFLCLPAGQSAQRANEFYKRNIKIVDLGADFRFRNPEAHQQWNRNAHPYPELLRQVVYGLPEWNREQICQAQLVSNPGCYPTSVLLAVLPFIKSGLLTGDPLIVDSKSGISGAGAALSKTTQFGEIHENFSPYKPGRVHRHVGEMEQELSQMAGHAVTVVFTPHLTPMFRGMLSTIYFKTKTPLSTDNLLGVLHNIYRDEPFIQILTGRLPATKLAGYSNYCFLSVESVPGTNTAILFSAIDNLGKGASGQAVQNMNLMLGFPETTGLY
jgi:N-acetyl-gamma-glutamyl-phosphate reductase